MTGRSSVSADIVAMSAVALHATGSAVPEWLHVLPIGEFSGVDGRGPYRNDNADMLISQFQQEGRKLAVDENHSTDLAAKMGFSTPARGWIVELQKRNDGIWGRVEWTPEGRALMQGKAYGYLSPVFTHSAKSPFAIQKLLRVALTNDPNLTSLTALHSARKGPQMDHEQLLSALRTALSLGNDADSAVILDAVNRLSQSRHSADPAQFVPIAMFQATVAELNKLRSGVSLENAERVADMAVRDGKLMPFMRDWAVSLCQANKAAFDDFLEGAGRPVGEFITSLQTKYDFTHSRLKDTHGDDAQLGEVHRNLGHSVEDVKTHGVKADK